MISESRRIWTLLAWAVVAGMVLGSCRTAQSDPERPGFRVRPGVAFEMAADSPSMPILDLRPREQFTGEDGHLLRARNVPLEELPDRLAELEWLRGVTFLVYCQGEGECSERAVRFFLAQGFEDVVLLDGGIEAWLEGGFHTVDRTEKGLADGEEPGLLIPSDAESIGDPRHLPEPP